MKTALITAMALICSGAIAHAEAQQDAETKYYEPGRVGVGVTAGDAFSAATVKVFLKGPFALQASLGVGYVYGAGVNFAVDGLYEFPQFFGNDSVGMNWYAGIGGTLGSGSWSAGSGTIGGGQLVGGYAVQFKQYPLEAMAEWRPTLLATGNSGPAHFAWYTLSIGTRYFF